MTVPPLTDDERAAFRHLERIARAVAGTAPAPDGAVLMALLGRPDGRSGITELAHALGWEKSRLSHHLSRMERRGLVVREQCPHDRRVWFVSPTDAGRRQAAAERDAHTAAVRSLLTRRQPLSPP